MSLDLSGAHLDGFSLIDCRVDSLECHHARFAGEAMLRGLHCGLAFFQGAIFEGLTDFRGLNLEHHVWFSHSTFSIGGRFNGATFSGSADFTDAEYEQGSESVNLNDVCIKDPNALSVEDGNAPSTWPPGWVAQPREDGTATLVRRSPQAQGETTS
ncbi:pentapeptide repeat-containing protein [Actinomadura terrae]|uniref:pentapeptide repeat-containing protein n=1 Tax=Actinomadura terrae TaxID=604353 RepID=UPI001FA7DAD7|nr:pentapeptide repeat-containing protein [Actinomadura terrae]